MWHVATDVVCVSVCVLCTWVSCAKMAEPIEMPFGVMTDLGPRNPVLLIVESNEYILHCKG